MTGTVIVCGLLVVVGLFGIVVPVLPGTLLVGLGFLVWASEEGTTESWTVFVLATGVLVAGTVVKYAVPGRRLKAAVPTTTLVVGGLVAIVGFFVIPVVGMLVGFPIGVYVAERVRVGCGRRVALDQGRAHGPGAQHPDRAGGRPARDGRVDRGRGRLVTAVLLALLGAVSYGISDFIGGLASRRTSVWPVAILSCTGSLVGAVVLAALRPGARRPRPSCGGAPWPASAPAPVRRSSTAASPAGGWAWSPRCRGSVPR